VADPSQDDLTPAEVMVYFDPAFLADLTNVQLSHTDLGKKWGLDRAKAKAMRFGVFYGMSAATAMKSLVCPPLTVEHLNLDDIERRALAHMIEDQKPA
jgi:hypothetical protein